MGETVTVRLDPETRRILRDLTRRRHNTRSAVIKDALRNEWRSGASVPGPTAWEVYSRLLPKLDPPRPGPKHNHARNHSRLLREILLAKRRAGTL